MRFAPNSSGSTLTGISLLRGMLHSSVIESRSFLPNSPILTEMPSFKCCARSDEGPAPDPFGKELIMSFTRSMVGKELIMSEL